MINFFSVSRLSGILVFGNEGLESFGGEGDDSGPLGGLGIVVDKVEGGQNLPTEGWTAQLLVRGQVLLPPPLL